MAKTKKKNDDLFDRLRAAGLRKRVARAVSEGGGKGEKAARKVLGDLQTAAEDVRGRITGDTKRKAAAKKAAATRKRRAAARRASARKGAATRAKKPAKR